MIEMVYFERFEDKDKYKPTKYLVTFECDKKDVYKLLELADMKQAANAHSCIVDTTDDCLITDSSNMSGKNYSKTTILS